MIIPACGGIETAPGFDNDGPCGLVSAEVFEADFVQVFVAQVCNGVLDDPCEARHRKMFFARVEERYTHADYDEVNRHCDAWPLRCQDARGIELTVLASHNEGVRHHARQQLAQIDEDEVHAVEQAERRRREHLEQERIEEEREQQKTTAFLNGLRQLSNVLEKSQAQPAPAPAQQRTHCTSQETPLGRTETNCTTSYR